MQRPANVQRFIDLALPVAKEVRRQWGVPVSVCLAQGGLESGWNFLNASAFGVAKGLLINNISISKCFGLSWVRWIALPEFVSGS